MSDPEGLAPVAPPEDEFANIKPAFSGSSPAVEYRFLTVDYLTGRIVGEVLPSSFDLERILSGAGAARVAVTLPHDEPTARALLTVTQPRRCGLYVERGGRAVWSGMIWARRWSNREPDSVVLEGAEDWSYLRRRYVKDLLSWTGGSRDDQFAIARDLIRYAQGQAFETSSASYPQTRGADVGITFDDELSGVRRTVAIKGHVAPKQVAEAIEQLCDATDGFDFTIEPGRSGSGLVTRSFRTWSPTRTRPASLTGWRAELGANLLAVSIPDDLGANATTVIGSNDLGQEKVLRAYATAGYLLESGYPVLEESLTARNVKDRTTLQQQVSAALSAYVAGDGITEAEVDPASQLLPLDRLELGDAVEVVIPRRSVYDESILTARYPDGLRQSRRVVAIKLAGSAAGERLTVKFEQADEPSIEIGDGAGRLT